MRVVSLVNLSRLRGWNAGKWLRPGRNHDDATLIATGYDADFVGSYLIVLGSQADSVKGLKKIYVEPVKRPRILRGRGASGSAINNGNGVVGPAIAAARSAASSTPPAQSSVRVC